MRFGKRNRNPLLLGRLSKKSGQEAGKALATEERDALLSGETDIDPSIIESTGQEGTAGTEATQRLLTILGRFQRQVARAKDGAPQELWSDECMNQLIAAVEIALREDWKDVAEVLTETGRVLQSYEDGGEAQRAVPFLSDSYDMLCLMVGDLMVGAVRPGVMKRWRQRYQRAITEVEAAGLSLVRDDDASGGEETGPAAEAPPGITAPPKKAPAANNPPPAADEAPFSITEEESADAAEDENVPPFPGADASAPEEPGSNGAGEPAPRFEPAESAAAEEDAEDESEGMFAFDMSGLIGATRKTAPETKEAESDAVAPPWDAEESEPTAVESGGASPFDAPAAEDEEAEAVDADAPSITERLDAFSETLAGMEGSGGDQAGAAETLLKQVLALEEAAQWDARPGSEAACETCLELLNALDAQGSDDRLHELLYGFCGAYMEAGESVDEPTLVNWRNECRAYFAGESAEEPAQSEPAAPRLLDHIEVAFAAASEVPAEEPAEPFTAASEVPAEELAEPFAAASEALAEQLAEPPAEPAPAETQAVIEPESPTALPPVHLHVALRSKDFDSPQQLLQVAMQAISQGEGENAKLLALRAAAVLAKSEAARAKAELGEYERKLREGGSAIEQAREAVTHAEAAVDDAETAVAEGHEALSARAEEEQTAAQQADEIRARIEHIDEEIRKLQEQRAEAAKELDAAQEELDAARRRKESHEEHIESLTAEEQAAREQLEDARRQVRELQRRHGEIESAMEKAREILMRRRASLQDIEETIEEVRGGEEPAETRRDEPGTLF